MTATWDLTPAEEAALDSRYWDERYAEPEDDEGKPDEDDEPVPASGCDCGRCCQACGHYPGCTSQQQPDDD